MKKLDTRDLYKRKCELEGLRDAITTAREELEDAEKELANFTPETEVPPHIQALADSLGEENPLEAYKESKRSELEEAVSEAEGNLESARIDFGEDEESELAELETLENEISDFMHGEAMIPEDCFEDYARELAEDLHWKAVREASWPFTCIDWSEAAEELRQDYSEVEYQGQTYLARS
jgi:hypothetical protein